MGKVTDDGPTFTFTGTTATIRIPKQVDWLPQPDITAHELALAVPSLFALATRQSWTYPEDTIAALPENVRRHFRIHD